MKKVTAVRKTCADCGSEISNYYAVRCRSCAAKVRMAREFPPTVRTCRVCGKEFKTKPSRDSVVHCSMKCRSAAAQVPCAACGKMFTPDHRNRGANHGAAVCSRECSNDVRATTTFVLVKCEQCGKEVRKYRSLAKHAHKFCSIKCKQAWWRGPNHSAYDSETVICQMCGNEFVALKSRNRKFCSTACRAASEVLPAAGYYGPDWKRQRRKARYRDGYKCRMCGVTESELGRELDVHHVVPFRKFGLINHSEANSLANLVSVCKACHRKLERAKPDHETVSTSG